ncbi:protein UmuC, partial [Acinetobacter baumannii]
VGIGPTRTLAKLANLIAKQQPGTDGVFSLFDCAQSEQDALMAALPVRAVWGVGSRLGRHLTAEGISSVLDLKRAASGGIRQRY